MTYASVLAIIYFLALTLCSHRSPRFYSPAPAPATSLALLSITLPVEGCFLLDTLCHQCRRGFALPTAWVVIPMRVHYDALPLYLYCYSSPRLWLMPRRAYCHSRFLLCIHMSCANSWASPSHLCAVCVYLIQMQWFVCFSITNANKTVPVVVLRHNKKLTSELTYLLKYIHPLV